MLTKGRKKQSLRQHAHCSYLAIHLAGVLEMNASTCPQSYHVLFELILPSSGFPFDSTLIEIWKSLSEGPPIDDQKLARNQATLAASNSRVQNVSIKKAPSDDGSDDERDPNDREPLPIASGISGDPYLDMEDDEAEDW